MSNITPFKSRYILAKAKGDQSYPVAQADELALLLDDINGGGEWTLWERAGDAAPVLIAYFASAPVRFLRSGLGRANNGRYCRTGVPGQLITQGVTVPEIEEMIARFAAHTASQLAAVS